MKQYVIKKLPAATKEIAWEHVAKAEVDVSPWKEFSSPYHMEAQVVYDDTALYVHLKSDERELRAVETKTNSDVCNDSCMEFFLSPDAEDTRYVNIEINPLGTMLVFVCNGRGYFYEIPLDTSIFQVKSVITQNGWELYYKVPFSFLLEHFEKISDTMYGNFYKCGNLTVREHYACWNPIDTPQPEFHCRQYFGELILEQNAD